MTQVGGASGQGGIFKAREDGGEFGVLYEFDGTYGGYPSGRLVAPGGVLYGTTQVGGAWNSGVIFKINEDGTGFTVLHEFDGTRGAYPNGSLVGSGGVLYGMTNAGGAFEYGLIFRVNADGTAFEVLHEFDGTNGGYPWTGLVAVDGALYGATPGYGVPSNRGTVFTINQDGTGFAVLHDYVADGAYSLVASRGVLHGTAEGGAVDFGVLFSMNLDGSGFTVLHEFDGDGIYPNEGLVVSRGVLYGTTHQGGTSGGGVVFKINGDGTGFASLYELGSGASFPQFGPVMSRGVLYGIAMSSLSGNEVLYSVAVPQYSAPPPISISDALATERANAAVGFTVRLGWAYETPVTVDYATADGSATAGSDCVATSGTVTFFLGNIAKTIQVPVKEDKIKEGIETFVVTLSNPTNATLWIAQGTGKILDPRMPIRGAATATPSPATGAVTSGSRVADQPVVADAPRPAPERGQAVRATGAARNPGHMAAPRRGPRFDRRMPPFLRQPGLPRDRHLPGVRPPAPWARRPGAAAGSPGPCVGPLRTAGECTTVRAPR